MATFNIHMTVPHTCRDADGNYRAGGLNDTRVITVLGTRPEAVAEARRLLADLPAAPENGTATPVPDAVASVYPVRGGTVVGKATILRRVMVREAPDPCRGANGPGMYGYDAVPGLEITIDGVPA
jgi:hypothetical protein